MDDCDSLEPENCAKHCEEARAQNLRDKFAATDEQIAQYANDLKAYTERFGSDPYEFLYADRSSNTFNTYIGPVFDKDKLFKLLVKSCCPVVCKGYRVLDDDPFNSDWHEICENTAHRAMKELGYE